MANRSDRPLVLYVDHTARMGGGEIALLNLVQAIDPQRYEPLVMLFASGPLLDKLKAAGVRTVLIEMAADIGDVRKDAIGTGTLLRLKLVLRTIRFAWRVRGEIRRLKPAIIHTNSLKSDIIGGFAARLARVPVIWHVRDRIAGDYLPPRVAAAFRWLAGRVPQVVIANSRSTLETLGPVARAVAIPSGAVETPSSFQVIHDGTHADRGPAADEPSGGRPLVVGIVGRLAQWKGQHVFIEAARRVRVMHENVRFRVIGAALFGEEAYAETLREQVKRAGLDDVVEFAGFRSDVGHAIAELDVLVHASITGEPFGQVIIEGMTASKPVVATRGGGVPEIVLDGQTGLLVPMDDAAAMAHAIGRLVEDAALRSELGRAGRLRVAEHFTIGHTAAKVQQVYDALLQGTPIDP